MAIETPIETAAPAWPSEDTATAMAGAAATQEMPELSRAVSVMLSAWTPPAPGPSMHALTSVVIRFSTYTPAALTDAALPCLVAATPTDAATVTASMDPSARASKVRSWPASTLELRT